ncbi:hypothetical protein Pcinc_009646 [Petrolisthes cinctipes]|uniref:Reverse transcriptase domain-containing protein n=1 Tax=Petrolisthes cinctipes TaxID=88211 RepID=A0AAE1G6Y8_PETCI|nr:hypothetical protein Pcinc_009646 [Petrolisthes cinctipes]
MSIDGMLSRLKSVVASLITQYIPVSLDRPHRSHPPPPITLKSNRRNAWLAYKHSRSIYGRHSQQADLALERFNVLNHMFRNYHVTQQIQYEITLIKKMKESPKLLHQYIRHKKVGVPSVGPMKLDSGALTADCGEMADIFASSFSTVYATGDPGAPFPHQHSGATITGNSVSVSLDEFGFRQGRTVDDQLLLVYDDVTSWLDSGCVVDVVLFDFSKAFDVVCHTILIDKLRHIGVGGRLLDWISDFLTDRTMRVSVSGVFSPSRPVLSGVPQGSVLGPLLFLIYINHIPSYIRSKCKFFADDLKLYMKIRHNATHPLAVDLSSLQKDIDNISRVTASWGLNFNPNKCVVIRCQRGSVDWTAVGSLQHYHLDNSDLSLADNHRDLGILVDNTLKFHAHIRATVNKAAGLANNLLKSTLCRSSDFMVTILKSHIRPVLEFVSTVWNTGYLGDLRLLESVQRRWTKLIDGLADLSYTNRLKALNLYSVQGRLLRADLIKYLTEMDSFHRIVDEMTPRTLVRKVINTAPSQDTPSLTSSSHTSAMKDKTKRKSKGGGHELRTKVLLQQQQQQSGNTSEVRGTDQTYANIANLTALASDDDDSINESIDLDAAAKFHRKKTQRRVELPNKLGDIASKLVAKTPVPSPTKKRKPLEDARPGNSTRKKRSRISHMDTSENTFVGDKTYANLSTNTLDSSSESTSIHYDMPKRQQGSQKKLVINLERLDGVPQDLPQKLLAIQSGAADKSLNISAVNDTAVSWDVSNVTSQNSLNVTVENESFETAQTDTRQKFARMIEKKKIELDLTGIFKDLKRAPTEEETTGTIPSKASNTSSTALMTEEDPEEELTNIDHSIVSRQSMLSTPGSKTPSGSVTVSSHPRASPREKLASPKPTTPRTPKTPLSVSRIPKPVTPRSRTPSLRPRIATPGSRTPTLRHTKASSGSRTPASELKTATPGSRTPTLKHTTASPRTRTPASERKTATPGSRTPTMRRKAASPRTRTPASGPKTAVPGSRTPTLKHTTASPRTRTPASGHKTKPGSRSPSLRLQMTASPESMSPSLKSPLTHSPQLQSSAEQSKGEEPAGAIPIPPPPNFRDTGEKDEVVWSSFSSTESEELEVNISRALFLLEDKDVIEEESSKVTRSYFQNSATKDAAAFTSRLSKSPRKGVVRELFNNPTQSPRKREAKEKSPYYQVNIDSSSSALSTTEKTSPISASSSTKITSPSLSQEMSASPTSPSSSPISKRSSPRKSTGEVEKQTSVNRKDGVKDMLDVGRFPSALIKGSRTGSNTEAIVSVSPSNQFSNHKNSSQAEPLSSQLMSTKNQVVTAVEIHKVGEQDERGVVPLENEDNLLIDVGSEEKVSVSEHKVVEERDKVVPVDDKEMEIEYEENAIDIEGENEEVEEDVDVEDRGSEDEEVMVDIGGENEEEEKDVDDMGSEETDKVDVEGIDEEPREVEGEEREERMAYITEAEEGAEERMLVDTEPVEGETTVAEERPVVDDDDELINFLPVVKRPIRRSMMKTQTPQKQQEQQSEQISSMMNVSVAKSNVSINEKTPAAATGVLGSSVTAPQPRQLTMKEFIQTLANKPVMPPSVTASANTRLADTMKKLQESRAGQVKTKTSGRPKSMASRKKIKKKELPASLSMSQTMEAFTHFARCKVTTDAAQRIVEVCEKWWSNVVRDLEFLKQTRSTHSSDEITAEDVARLMKRQGFAKTQTELIARVEEYLPAEQWKYFKPTAYAHGKVFPNDVQPLLPD